MKLLILLLTFSVSTAQTVDLQDFKDYIILSRADTIKGQRFRGEFIIDHGYYKELMSQKQIDKANYRHARIWVEQSGDSLIIWDYFIRQPTMEGFIEFIEQKPLP